jgi:hypothetical protein
MQSTGSTCQQSGIYANDCHRKQIALSKGETFPPAQAAAGPLTGGSCRQLARRDEAPPCSVCLVTGDRFGSVPQEQSGDSLAVLLGYVCASDQPLVQVKYSLGGRESERGRAVVLIDHQRQHARAEADGPQTARRVRR